VNDRRRILAHFADPDSTCILLLFMMEKISHSHTGGGATGSSTWVLKRGGASVSRGGWQCGLYSKAEKGIQTNSWRDGFELPNQYKTEQIETHTHQSVVKRRRGGVDEAAAGAVASSAQPIPADVRVTHRQLWGRLEEGRERERKNVPGGKKMLPK